MSDINNVFLTGRMGTEPEMKYFESGKVKTNISIGVNKWNCKKESEEVTWFDCVAWGKKAEFLGDVAKKGAMVYVSGTLQKDVYKDENGKNCSRTYILIDEVKVNNKKTENENK